MKLSRFDISLLFCLGFLGVSVWLDRSIMCIGFLAFALGLFIVESLKEKKSDSNLDEFKRLASEVEKIKNQLAFKKL